MYMKIQLHAIVKHLKIIILILVLKRIRNVMILVNIVMEQELNRIIIVLNVEVI